jgi:large subunit ribosomal protein L18e
MPRRTGPTDPHLAALIRELKETSRKSGTPIWQAIAKKLAWPRRRRVSVNLSRIDRHTVQGDTVVVPGTVLAAGGLSKPVNIAAWRFSASARQKIDQVGGRCLTIGELVEKNPRGSGVKIIT